MAVIGQVKKFAGRPLFPVFGTTAAAYDPDAQAYFNALSVQPNSARKQLISDLYTGLKSDGVFSLFDAFWMESNGQAQGMTINGKNPATFTLLPVNSPTYTAGLGYAGNGTSSYFNTQFTPSTAGGNYSLNGASFGAYINAGTNTDGVFPIMGLNDTTVSVQSILYPLRGSNVQANINGGGTSVMMGASATRFGWTSTARQGSTRIEGYRNGTKLTGNTVNSLAQPTIPFYIGGRNNAGVADAFVDNRWPFAYIGGNMSDAQQLALYNRVITYLTAIGAN